MNRFNAFLWGMLAGQALTAALMMCFWTRVGTWQTAAVQHGAARWEVAADGSTTFKWNDEPVKGEEK